MKPLTQLRCSRAQNIHLRLVNSAFYKLVGNIKPLVPAKPTSPFSSGITSVFGKYEPTLKLCFSRLVLP